MILAIDPGPTESAYVLLRGGDVVARGKLENDDMRQRIIVGASDYGGVDRMVIEQIKSYGMRVGEEVFETCVWSGRFAETWDYRCVRRTHSCVFVPRLAVKMHLCHSARAKDGDVRQALIDRYGGKDAAIGRKKTPGPLYGVHADEWQALALAVTFSDLQAGETSIPKGRTA